MNVFIDANIFLGFYSLSPDELEELRKLAALVDAGDLVLWLPEQARDEFHRNRPRVAAEALKALRDSRLKVVFPEMSRGFPEYAVLESAVQMAQKAHSALVSELERKIDAEALDADEVIADLFKRAKAIPTDGLMNRARDRRDLRRPPGKHDSLGDALNWEALLDAVSEEEDIHIVTADGDFRSPLGLCRFNDALATEWVKAKRGAAYLYRDLGSFSKQHFPALALATDVPKLRAIHALAASSNFAVTHSIVSRLSEFAVFTPEQAHLLVSAAAENSQVRWIAQDKDVCELLRRVIDSHRNGLDENDVATLERAMRPPAPPADSNDGDDIPF